MSSRGADSDSDAPEEFTSEQGIQQDEEIRKVKRDNKVRAVREGKERRRRWAEKKITPRPSQKDEGFQDTVEIEAEQESQYCKGMLPDDIVQLIAAQEKKVFLSDSEEEEKTERRPTSKKTRPKNSGLELLILKDIPPAQCLENSLEFLKKRKMQVSRSSAVLNNSNQALRFLSTSGLLSKK